MNTTSVRSTRPPKNQYLNNKDLLAEIKICKEKGQMSDKCARMLQLLCANIAKKGNFINYTYNDDMQGYAMMMLVRTWKSFDPSKSSNAFAFFTQCIKNSFIQFLKSEKKHRLLRDKLLIDRGMNPSFGYQESNDGHIVEDEEDYHAQKQVADSLMSSLSEYDTLMQNQGDGDSAVDEDSSTDPVGNAN